MYKRQIQGRPSKKGAIFAFTLEGSAHAHDISTILDKQGIAVRAGQHCAGPLMHHMGINASCRASFAFYNTKQEVDKLLSGLERLVICCLNGKLYCRFYCNKSRK